MNKLHTLTIDIEIIETIETLTKEPRIDVSATVNKKGNIIILKTAIQKLIERDTELREIITDAFINFKFNNK